MVTQMADDCDLEPFKRAAARAAVAEVEEGMIVGLGTGTTAAFAIAALAGRVADGLRVTTVATSLASAAMAESFGLRPIPFETLAQVDIAIDGADEIDGGLRAIKGHGGAMLREKIVATASRRMIAVVDESKQVTKLGAVALPVEILPFATEFVTRRITELGAEVSQRMADGSAYRTDQHNFVLDCRFGVIDQPETLASALSAIPGVLGHGLFLDEIDAVYIGRADGTLYLAREA
jgi:ribose 5-phosphate isomerase A